jgi:pSer/pThr/pTyr-binding forkhead associated (FHA) protein
VQVEELAAELAQLGRERFESRYGRHYLVLSNAELADDISMFVNTASREIQDLLDGRQKRGLDVRPLVVRGKAKKVAAVSLGRDSHCDVVLRHPRVSSRHAEVSHGGGLLLVTDLGSKNGTRLNGTKLRARTPTAVDVGDSLAFGPVTATLWGIDDLLAAMS